MKKKESKTVSSVGEVTATILALVADAVEPVDGDCGEGGARKPKASKRPRTVANTPDPDREGILRFLDVDPNDEQDK